MSLNLHSDGFLHGYLSLGEHLGKHLHRKYELLENVSNRLKFSSWFFHYPHNFCLQIDIVLVTFMSILSWFYVMLGLTLSEMIFSNFKITGRVDKLVDLFTKLTTKVEKKPTFCFNIFVDILGEWNHLYMFKVFLTLLTCKHVIKSNISTLLRYDFPNCRIHSCNSITIF